MLIYGLSRTLVEFVRVPDEHIGYLAGGWFTEGQLLSLPMIIVECLQLACAPYGNARGEINAKPDVRDETGNDVPGRDVA